MHLRHLPVLGFAMACGGAANTPSPTVPIDVALIRPASQEWLSGDVTIEVEVTGPTLITLLLDGVPLVQGLGPPYTYTWDSRTALNGDHTLTAASATGGIEANTTFTLHNGGAPDPDALLPERPLTETCGVAWVGVASEFDSAELFVDGESLGTDDTAPFEWEWNTAIEADGERHLVVLGPADSPTVRRAWTVLTDNSGPCESPEVSLQGLPEAASEVTHGVIDVTGTTSLVQRSIDGRRQELDAPYLFHIDASALSQGEHEISAYAYDEAGHRAVDTVTLIADHDPPVVEILGLGETLAAGPNEIGVIATDDVGLAEVSFIADGRITTWTQEPFTRTLSYDASPVQNSLISLAVVATDRAGNRDETQHLRWVDPITDIRIANPTDGEVLSTVANVTVTSPEGSSLMVDVSLDDTLVGTTPITPWSLTVDLCTLADGGHLVEAKTQLEPVGTDAIVIVVANGAPEVTLDHDGGVVSDPMITVQASWSPHPASSVTWTLDGEPLEPSSELTTDCGGCCIAVDTTLELPLLTEGTHRLEVEVTRDGDSAVASIDLEVAADQDGDGALAPVVGGDDCDDQNPTVAPHLPEVCNGRDDDCDGTTDVGVCIDDVAALVLDGTAGDQLGAALVCADVDGDGPLDLVISAPGSLAGAGSLSVVHGPVHFASMLTQVSAPGSVAFGGTIAHGGDVDLNGSAELLVGDVAAGEVYFVAGPALSTGLKLTAAGETLGTALTGGADLDGDGLLDAAASMPSWDSDRGAVLVWEWPAASGDAVTLAHAMVTGTIAGAPFGADVASADVDGDGLADLMLSDHAAVSWVAGPLPGGTAALPDMEDGRITAADPSDAVTRVTPAPDLDGDGSTDFVVATPSHGGVGAVYALTSPMTTASLDGAWMTVLGVADAPVTEAAVFDGDGDGTDDLLVSAPDALDPIYGSAVGRVATMAAVGGVVTLDDAQAIIPGIWAGTRFGTPLIGCDDLTGDAQDDLVVGAYGLPGGPGSVYLLAGPGPW